MKHELADFVDEYRAEFESGRLQAGYEVALFCIANGVSIAIGALKSLDEDIARVTADAALSEDRQLAA